MLPPSQVYRAPTQAPTFSPLPKWIVTALIVIVALEAVAIFGGAGLITAAIHTATRRGPNQELFFSGMGVVVLGVLLMYVQVAIGLFWVYRTWSWLPPDQRWTSRWSGVISPQAAALFLLIPYFHYYWMFVINGGVCDAMDRLRVHYRTSEGAPKGLAIAACVTQLFIPIPVAGILWILYARRIQRMTEEMSQAATEYARGTLQPAHLMNG